MLPFGPMIAAVMLASPAGDPFTLKSAAFAPGGAVPSVHTCDGADTSPPLEWSGVPAGTRSFALVVHDPDAPAGDWLHWVAWNIPAASRALPAGVAAKETLPDGTAQGRNDFGNQGYGGPCPPGGTHRYVFSLRALDTTLTLPATASRDPLAQAITGHVVATGE